MVFGPPSFCRCQAAGVRTVHRCVIAALPRSRPSRLGNVPYSVRARRRSCFSCRLGSHDFRRHERTASDDGPFERHPLCSAACSSASSLTIVQQVSNPQSPLSRLWPVGTERSDDEGRERGIRSLAGSAARSIRGSRTVRVAGLSKESVDGRQEADAYGDG